MRDLTWSYIHQTSDLPDELYNLLEDPGEKSNVIDEYPDVAERLRSRLGLRQVFKKVQIPGLQARFELEGTAAG